MWLYIHALYVSYVNTDNDMLLHATGGVISPLIKSILCISTISN